MKYTPTPDGQELGGFTQLPASRYTFVVDSVEEQAEKGKVLTGKEDGPLSRVRIQFKVSRGEYAGSPISFFVGLGFPRGIQDYLKVIAVSGAASTLGKSHGLPPITEGWEDKIIRSRKLFNALRTVLPGLEIDGDVKHRPYTAITQNEDGTESKVEKMAVNITAVYPSNGMGSTAPAPQSNKATGGEDW